MAEAAKSVSHEHTFDVDTNDWEEIERTLLGLSEGVAGRLRDGGVEAGTIAVKVRDSAFETHTRQRTLPAPTDEADVIWRVRLELARPQVRGIRVRLLGVAATHLTEPEQLELFAPADDRRRLATAAADAIKRASGRVPSPARACSATRGGTLRARPSERPEARRIGRPGPPATGSSDDPDRA